MLGQRLDERLARGDRVRTDEQQFEPVTRAGKGDRGPGLGITTTSAAPYRNNLIKKGMVYSPTYGDTAFTVPLFDDFMRRVMPKFEARATAND